MESKTARIFVFVVALMILVSYCWILYKDLNYFITRQVASGHLTEINTKDGQSMLLFQVQYYNNFINETVKCKVALKKSYKRQLDKDDLNNVKIFYARGYPTEVILSNYQSPHSTMVLFDFVIIVLMGVAIYSSIKP